MRSKISRPSCSISNWIVATLLMTCGWCSINCKAAKNQKRTVAARVSEGSSLCRCGGRGGKGWSLRLRCAEAKAGAFAYGAEAKAGAFAYGAEAKAGAFAYGAWRQRLEPSLTA